MPDDIHTNFVIEETNGNPPAGEPVTDDDNEIPPPPLWKQALGAGVGAMIALAIYSAYTAVAPTISAWVSASDEEHGAPVKEVSTGARKQRAQ